MSLAVIIPSNHLFLFKTYRQLVIIRVIHINISSIKNFIYLDVSDLKISKPLLKIIISISRVRIVSIEYKIGAYLWNKIIYLKKIHHGTY